MGLPQQLQAQLEQEEARTVGDAFGGRKAPGKCKPYSVAAIRDWLIQQPRSPRASALDDCLILARKVLPANLFTILIGNCLRVAFLIELTNLTVGSTKMKTRWVPGLILMPQPHSFEPVEGSFEPGNDPRSSDFRACLDVFVFCVSEICDRCAKDKSVALLLQTLDRQSAVPYESVFDYSDAAVDPVHKTSNISWVLNGDLRWLLQARPLLWEHLDKKLVDKMLVKTYKTDRALTGKDKTNRAKRWEVLAGDFQHASLTDCWSVERKLYEGLVSFENFPAKVGQAFIAAGLVSAGAPNTTCPVTWEVLDYKTLLNESVHGRHEYQVGHGTPLKRGGRHVGRNVGWQSADGNRIQGDLTLQETDRLLNDIAARRTGAGPKRSA